MEHLKLIQGVINRMAQVSFILKGWTVTIVVAVLGFASNASNHWMTLLALFPTFIFWGLDAYYLRQERLYRCLYEMVRLDPSGINIPSFSMDTTPCQREVGSWCSTLWRPTVGWFYGAAMVLTMVVSALVYLS